MRFWAHPEGYEHIAGEPERRLDITFRGAETAVYDALVEKAGELGLKANDVLRRLLSRDT